MWKLYDIVQQRHEPAAMWDAGPTGVSFAVSPQLQLMGKFCIGSQSLQVMEL